MRGDALMNISFDDFKEKTILVTGATRGIGRAIVQSLASQGAGVAFNFREGSEERAQSLAKELLKIGASKAVPLMFDVTNAGQMKNAVDHFLKTDGPVHGLVNNAGMAGDQLLLRLKEEDIDKMFDTNLKSALLLTQMLSRNFLKLRESSVVNVSSVIGLMGNPGQITYAASKAGIIGFTKSLAREMGIKNLRCNAICPGFIVTDMTKNLNQETYLKQIPLQKMGRPEDVAALTCFLLSRASSYITGEIIKIDGGLYI